MADHRSVPGVPEDAALPPRGRREQPLADILVEPPAEEASDPEAQALLADSVGPALMVVLDTLAPAERLAFVLHDIFAVIGRRDLRCTNEPRSPDVRNPAIRRW